MYGIMQYCQLASRNLSHSPFIYHTHTAVSPIFCLVPGELTSAPEQAGLHTPSVYIPRQATMVVNNSTAVLEASSLFRSGSGYFAVRTDGGNLRNLKACTFLELFFPFFLSL